MTSDDVIEEGAGQLEANAVLMMIGLSDAVVILVDNVAP